MGGTIEVKSPVQQGHGAAFVITFPVESQPANELAEAGAR
jgi:signal transduction histidine kinase